jgi:cytochrome b6-f complex iron-sulfur subunit
MSKGSPQPPREKRPTPIRGAPEGLSRGAFLGQLTIGALAIAGITPLAMSVRSVVPNVLYEPPRRMKVGSLDRFTDGATFLPKQRVFIFREAATLYSISARCTHLGCTVQLAKMPQVEGGFEFHCPCHGSKFRADGANFAGPAPSPLSYYRLSVAEDDGQLILDLSEPTDKGWRLTLGAPA